MKEVFNDLGNDEFDLSFDFNQNRMIIETYNTRSTDKIIFIIITLNMKLSLVLINHLV